MTQKQNTTKRKQSTLHQLLSFIVQSNSFLKKFVYFLDGDDRRGFIKFVILTFISGLLSIVGIGAVLPFAHLLIDPKHLTQYPIVGQFGYIHAVAICSGGLILAYWVKNIVALIVLKEQTAFLQNLAAKIRCSLFNRYIYSPYYAHVNRSSPELVSNISVEVNQVTNGILSKMGNLINEVITSSMVLVFLLWLNPMFGLVIIGGLGLTARVFITRFRLKARYYGQLRAESNKRLLRSIWQGLGGLKETKIYNREGFFIDQVKEETDNLVKTRLFSLIFQQSPRYLLEVVAVTLVIGLLFIFIMMGYSGQTVLVLLTVFGVAAVQLLPSIIRLMGCITQIKFSMPAVDKIYQEFQDYDAMNGRKKLHTDNAQSSVEFTKEIRLEQIEFAYQDRLVLDKINLTIPKGKRVAFVGASGAGKTTLVDIILGVLRPLNGRIIVDDTEITEDNIGAWQRHFGYIPQMIYIYDCTLRENIAFGMKYKDVDDDQVWHVLGQAALTEFVRDECPDGLDTLVGENGIRLSGGQRQRIGIARALYHNPDILVMDEATAALDNETEKLVTQALSNIEKDRTIITIAHRLTTIQNYDKICLMHQGQLVDTGDYKTLYNDCAMFRQMVDLPDHPR